MSDAAEKTLSAQPLLQVKNLEAFYGPVMALRGVSPAGAK